MEYLKGRQKSALLFIPYGGSYMYFMSRSRIRVAVEFRIRVFFNRLPWGVLRQSPYVGKQILIFLFDWSSML